MVIILLGIAFVCIFPGWLYYLKTNNSMPFWLSGWGTGLYFLIKPMTEKWVINFATNEDNTMRKLSLMAGAVICLLMLVASIVSFTYKDPEK